jgi:hypothetical protein
MELVVVLLSLIIGLALGFNFQAIHEKLDTLLKKEPEADGGIASPLPPRYIREASGIVSPKSPSQIEFEEGERIRQL